MRQDRRRHVAIHLNAGHDVNGNPRRVYVVIDRYGAIVATVDEGYSGTQALKDAGFPNVIHGPQFAITPGEYRDLCRKDRPHVAGERDERWAAMA